MFLRFSFVTVILLNVQFGAPKSVANLPNGNVSDNCLDAGNIERAIMKLFSNIKANNITSDGSNVNADSMDMLLTRVILSILKNSSLSSDLSFGHHHDGKTIQIVIGNHNRVTVNNNYNYYNMTHPSDPELLFAANQTSTTTSTSTSRPNATEDYFYSQNSQQ